MPVIKVFAGKEPYLAAALMGVMAGRGSEPPPKPAKRKGSIKTEKTQAGNPNELTIKQHVFPCRSIQRFADQSGRVSVHEVGSNKIRRLKPDNQFFCAPRAWDQTSEAGFMKRIEDEFQQIVSQILDGTTTSVAPQQKPAIDLMFSLWFMRSRYRYLESQEVQLNKIVGDELTKAQEENLEKNGYIFARKYGAVPARQINGLELQLRTYDYARSLATSISRWAVISSQSGEFLVPDIPAYTIIPVSPQLALVASQPDGIITEQNLAEVNRAMKDVSQDYFFAHDFQNCPL
jgi:hypothetical protein